MDETSTTPFDDYSTENGKGPTGSRGVHLRRIQGALRAVSAVSFCLAICCACVVVALDFLRFSGAYALSWRLKSAFPLIFIGLSYGCLQLTLPRTWKELALGLAVGTAFILWGMEQFVPNQTFASLIDDAVMFLFVLDLGIVIRGHLKQKAA